MKGLIYMAKQCEICKCKNCIAGSCRNRHCFLCLEKIDLRPTPICDPTMSEYFLIEFYS